MRCEGNMCGESQKGKTQIHYPSILLLKLFVLIFNVFLSLSTFTKIRYFVPKTKIVDFDNDEGRLLCEEGHLRRRGGHV